MPSRLTVCPPEYQARITHAGGTNRYGEPNFKLVWGEAHKTRAGGYWEQEGVAGYRDVYLNDTPCWLLLEWKSPDEYGSPTLFYMDNYDEESGLQTLGQFPYQGKYEVLFILRDTYMWNGELVVESMKLNAMLIDTVIPLMMFGKNLSYARRAQAIKDRREMEEAEKLKQTTDALLDAKLAFGGASFRSRFGTSSDLIRKKEEVLRKGMVAAYRQMKARGLGVSIGQF